MARTVDELEQELLALPRDERARLAHELIVSLDEGGTQSNQREWAEEIRRRTEQLERGDVELVSIDEALRSVRVS